LLTRRCSGASAASHPPTKVPFRLYSISISISSQNHVWPMLLPKIHSATHSTPSQSFNRMKAQLLRHVCCGCVEAAAAASPPQQPSLSSFNFRPSSSLPARASVKKTSPVMRSTSSSSSSSLRTSSSRGEALYTKSGGARPRRKRDEDDDGLLSNGVPPLRSWSILGCSGSCQ